MTDLPFRLNSTLAILTGIVIFLLFLDYLQVIRRPHIGLYLALLTIVWGVAMSPSTRFGQPASSKVW